MDTIGICSFINIGKSRITCNISFTLPQYFISPVNESLGGNNYLDENLTINFFLNIVNLIKHTIDLIYLLLQHEFDN
jgi:hypothetical protein